MCYYKIDVVREMAKTPILSLDCVDVLLSSLRRVMMTISIMLQVNFLGWHRFVICNPLWVKPLRRTPYLLGQIGLVGNSPSSRDIVYCENLALYRLP